MKQPNFIQTKLNYAHKSSKYVEIDSKSIDVDTVKVYEINDEIPPIKVVPIETIQLESCSSQEKLSGKKIGYDKKLSLPKDGTLNSKFESLEEKTEKLIIRMENEKKNKSSPIKSYMTKIQRIISHFLTISETNHELKITSEHFYNLCQSRRKLLLTNEATSKDFFENSYTNILSFLQCLITSKQKEYEIYEEVEEFEKILGILENEIIELTEIYIADEEAKYRELFCTDLTYQVQKMVEKCHSIHSKEKKIPIIEEKEDIKETFHENADESQAEEGEMDLSELSNRSFPHLSMEVNEGNLVFKDSLNFKENGDLIELEGAVIEKEIRDETKLVKLVSSFEEREIYLTVQHEKVVENESNSQKFETSSNHMEIEEEI